MRGLLVVVCGLLVLGVCACDEEKSPFSPPVIQVPVITCGSWLGEGRINYDGDVLQRLEVKVTDPKDDVVSVTATWRGAIIPLLLAGDEEGVYSLETATHPDLVLRCDPPAELLIRAEDRQGSVTELIVPGM